MNYANLGLTDFELMNAAIADVIVEDIPLEAVFYLSCEAESALEFFAGVQALAQLGDIINDHYDRED